MYTYMHMHLAEMHMNGFKLDVIFLDEYRFRLPCSPLNAMCFHMHNYVECMYMYLCASCLDVYLQ